MLVLFETPAGYSMFKVSNEKKLAKTDPDDIYETFFEQSSTATDLLSLVAFEPFADTADAVSAATACIESKPNPSLMKFLKKSVGKYGSKDISSLVIADKGLAGGIQDELPSVKCRVDSRTQELFRGIRCHMDELMENNASGSKKKKGVSPADLRAMQLGLSHSLSRYKLKFSADKVDTMVIQAVGLLDELDKEINTYAMRVKEWYGWHFPELQAILNAAPESNAAYSKVVLAAGFRHLIRTTDLTTALEDESMIAAVKAAAEVSMGTEISDLDVINIQSLAEQVLSLLEYRTQLFSYLKHRMNAVAPNLTVLVGELVGARLVSHAGSLLNLAKQPASTIQILGAEKALFRALKTKHDTPKYGLIYHASLLGQAGPKHKGKIARVLAAKTALAVRVDALTDDSGDGVLDTTLGYECRAKVEMRLRQLEQGNVGGGGATTNSNNKNGKLTGAKTLRYDPVAAKAASTGTKYNESSDMVLADDGNKKANSDDSDNEDADMETPKKKKKDKKKDKKRKADDLENGDDEDEDDEKAKKSAKKAAKKAKKRKSKE